MTAHSMHGRYARMFAFWALLAFVAYGCFKGDGLADRIASWMGDADRTFIDPFPILKTLKASTCIAIGVLAATAFVIMSVLNRPRIANVLTEAEVELTKVTWPSWAEAWQGTIAVVVMVLVLFVFLTICDWLLVRAWLLLVAGGVR
ncbi:MAG: preprotein translocase subunit SecE [Planctomycetes bacterium]|nr:preprotein translocase subunit SecE [Planctomycetota bacterium]